MTSPPTAIGSKPASTPADVPASPQSRTPNDVHNRANPQAKEARMPVDLAEPKEI